MKNIFSSAACLLLALSLQAQDTLSVAIVPDMSTYAGTGQLDIFGMPKSGANFVVTGFVYPGDYFEKHCPVNNDCGVIVVFTPDTVYTQPEHPGEVIGRWDFRGFTRMDLAQALANGGTPTFSTQTFKFDDTFEECPGCTLVTEGKDLYGGAENIPFKKSIVGGTTDTFRLIRGEVEQIIYKQPENKNETGGYNLKATFVFEKD